MVQIANFMFDSISKHMRFSFYLEARGNVQVSWELYECVVAKLHDNIMSNYW